MVRLPGFWAWEDAPARISICDGTKSGNFGLVAENKQVAPAMVIILNIPTVRNVVSVEGLGCRRWPAMVSPNQFGQPPSRE